VGSLTYKDFKVKTDINDERLEKLKTYFNLIKIWQKKFNLISQKSFESIWERHFLDSYQILKLIGNKKRILDIGSGAGFPAIVCAICSNNNFDLVEINQKKCNFLNEVKDIIGIKNIFIHHSRIENLKIINNFDYISARAVTSLDKLLKYSFKFYKNGMYCIFLKGKTVSKEIEIAKKKFVFDFKSVNSITNKDGKILLIKNINNKNF
jgi:16S rRNA (guanine527-N7)-methyltransferase